MRTEFWTSRWPAGSAGETMKQNDEKQTDASVTAEMPLFQHSIYSSRRLKVSLLLSELNSLVGQTREDLNKPV